MDVGGLGIETNTDTAGWFLRPGIFQGAEGDK